MDTSRDLESTAVPVDKSGYRYFSAGEAGAAHAMAHDLLDAGRELEGLYRLGAWLEQHECCGPEGVHLQWHQAVFEIAAGRLEAAHARFRRHVLPAVAPGRALTDAPSLLWRLWLAGGPSLELEWGPVRDVAARRLSEQTTDSPYVVLHQVLALAGARDVVAIDRWLDGQYAEASSATERFLLQMAWALRTFANRDYAPAATLLESVRQVAQLGGSFAQNRLFVDLREHAQRSQLSAAA